MTSTLTYLLQNLTSNLKVNLSFQVDPCAKPEDITTRCFCNSMFTRMVHMDAKPENILPPATAVTGMEA